MEQQKHGFIAEPIVPEDAVFGGAWNLSAKGFKGVQLVPDGNWEPFLFDLIYSHQAPEFETNGCVSHGTLNCVELLNNRVHAKLLDLSDRFLAKTSGTDPARGATPKQVADSLRHKWSVFENEWPTNAARTVEEFYATIPDSLFTTAFERGKTFAFGYERVNPTIEEMKEALKYSPLGISCNLWGDGDEWYKPIGQRDGHYLVLLRIREDGKFVLLDSYPDSKGSYLKIAKPFAPEVAMRYALDYEKYDLVSKLLSLVKQLFEMLKKNAVNIIPPVETNPRDLPMNQPDKDYITPMAEGIRRFEKWEKGEIKYD